LFTVDAHVEVAAEKNSTLVLPFPVELLRFLERSTPEGAAGAVPDDRSTTGQSGVRSAGVAASRSDGVVNSSSTTNDSSALPQLS
jgi:hypothetical protein